MLNPEDSRYFRRFVYWLSVISGFGFLGLMFVLFAYEIYNGIS